MTTSPSDELFQDYERHYRESGAFRWEASISDVKNFHLERLPRWLDRIPTAARILDAGCANGYLLDLARDAGYENLTGIDISEQLAANARQRLAGSAEIIVTDVQSYLDSVPDASFDVIFFHHVLEHIPRDQTLSLLRSFYRVLKPKGYLNIKTPNASFILAGNHMYGDFTHVTHFNERSMVQVLEAAGFNTKQIRFLLHPPKLFWSLRYPKRAILRAINRLRWHMHHATHILICALVDQHPIPKAFEIELDTLVRR